MRRASLFRHGSAYAAGDLAERLVGLAMLPVYAYTLAPADFGVLALVQTLTGLGSALLGLGLYATITRYYYNPPEGRAGNDVIAVAWPVLLCVPLVFLAVLGTVGHEVLASLFSSLDFATFIVPALVITYLNVAFIELALAVARTRQQPRVYVSMTLVRAILTAGFSCVMLLGTDRGPLGVVQAQLVATILAAVGCGIWLGRIGRPQLDGNLARTLLTFGAPLIPMSTSAWALRLQDRLILDHLSGVAQVGVYAMASRVVTPLQVVFDAAFRVIQPTFSAAAQDSAQVRTARSFVGQYVIGAVALTLASCVCAPVLVTALLPGAYHVSALVVQVLLVALFFMGMFRLATGAAIFFGGRTAVPLTLTVAGVAVNAALNVMLIPPFGIEGVACASAVTSAVLAAVAWRLSPLRIILDQIARRLATWTSLGLALMAAVIALHSLDHELAALVVGVLGAVSIALMGTRQTRDSTVQAGGRSDNHGLPDVPRPS